uniref:Uncharacterized protein n=1 Tax=Plectus sambesii TaxID=2011161 RepID=A0A914X464_9BILA
MGGLYWTNVKCFLWSAHGLIALNVQSGMGLVLGVDRLLAIVQPLRFLPQGGERHNGKALTYIAVVRYGGLHGYVGAYSCWDVCKSDIATAGDSSASPAAARLVGHH